MAINQWWADDPTERYWLEVTDRDVLGSNIIAPKFAASGKETPTYALVGLVKPGDVVFHWWKRPGEEPAIVGSSRVVGDPFDSELLWQAHGSYGRSDKPTDRDAWEAPLSGYEDLESPVTLADLRDEEAALRSIRDQLAAGSTGGIYFPFAFSNKRPLRTGQGYLFKLPAAVVELLPNLRAVAPRPRRVPPSSSAARPGTKAINRAVEAVVRKAIERHAVDWALNFFGNLGFEVEDVGDTESYDIYALSEDLEEFHVEVKGSSTPSTSVNLTDGEVKHWGPSYRRVLVVVDRISWKRTSNGRISTSGGRPRVWWDWEIDFDLLEPTQYRYTLDGSYEHP